MSMMRRRESERDLPAPKAGKADEAARARSSLGLRSLLASYGRWQGATVCGIGCVCGRRRPILGRSRCGGASVGVGGASGAGG